MGKINNVQEHFLPIQKVVNMSMQMQQMLQYSACSYIFIDINHLKD